MQETRTNNVFWDYFDSHKYGIIIGAASVFVLLLALSLTGALGTVTTLFVLMAVAVLPSHYQKYTRVEIGLEFIVFATVLAGIKYGFTAGFFFGMIAKLLSDVMNGLIGEWTPLNAVAMGLGGIVAAAIGQSTHILITGMLALIVVEAVRKIPVALTAGNEIRTLLIFNTSVHLLFSLWLFGNMSKLFGV